MFSDFTFFEARRY